MKLGKVNLWLLTSPTPSNGSATSEDLFWKLDALQMFVLDLHWPEPEFAKHLEQRLKLMASDMMEACVKRSEVRRTSPPVMGWGLSIYHCIPGL